MIIDTLEHIGSYRGINPNLDIAIQWLQTQALHALSIGRHMIQGDKAYCEAVCAELAAPTDLTAEAHTRYLDIHVALEPGEQIAFASTEHVFNWSLYSRTNDAQTARLKQNENKIVLYPGMFAICFPQDAHCPALASGTAKTVRKLIIKVLAN